MSYKPLLFLMLFSSSALACFTNSNCPAGNVCVKTGNIMGVCLSQTGLYYTNTPYEVLPPAGGDVYTTTTSTTTAPNTTTVVVPNSTTTVTQVPTPGVVVTPSGGTAVPVVPTYTPPVTAGVCTNDINCPSGFVCSRPGGTFRGICTQLAQ